VQDASPLVRLSRTLLDFWRRHDAVTLQERSAPHCRVREKLALRFLARYAKARDLRSADRMYVRMEPALWELLHTPPTTPKLHVEELLRRFKTHCTPVVQAAEGATASGGARHATRDASAGARWCGV